MNSWKYIKSNIDINDINRFYQKMGITPPELVAEFILNHNNGRPHLNNVKMPSGEEHIFEKLLSFNPKDTENVFSTYENIRTSLTPEILPIAADPFGNYFFLNTKNNFFVEFWNHEDGSTKSTGMDLFQLIKSLY